MGKMPNEAFRERMYKFLKTTLSPSITKDDLDIIIHLLSIVLGDQDYELDRLQYYTMIDYTPTDRLRQLGSNVAFPWSNALTPEQQRQYIKLYHLIRQRRGTKWSIENLCKVFGQDTASYYSASDLSSVRLLEYPYNYGGETPLDDSGNPLPFCHGEEGAPEFIGDLVLRIPAISTILYDEIMNTKLAGTRLMFLFNFLMGVFKCEPQINALTVYNYYFDPRYGKDDLKIMDWKTRIPNTNQETRIIKYLEDWNVGHYVVDYDVDGSMIMNAVATTPYDTGFILNETNLTNYRGYIINSTPIKDDDVLYN